VKQNKNQLKNIKQRGSKERKKDIMQAKKLLKRIRVFHLIKIKIDPFYSTIFNWSRFRGGGGGYNFHAILIWGYAITKRLRTAEIVS
jgi:hypothetical protein